MSKKQIRIALSQAGIREAIQEIRDYYTELQPKLKEICRRLAEIGADLAQQSFSTAAYDGINDVVVTYEEIPNGYKIVASGQAVCFIEFGAGVHYGGNYPGNRPAGIVGIGEYGKGQGKNDYWRFNLNGKFITTHGNAPTGALFWTKSQLKGYLDEIAKEVFSE